jgi:hypothetical protein
LNPLPLLLLVLSAAYLPFQSQNTSIIPRKHNAGWPVGFTCQPAATQKPSPPHHQQGLLGPTKSSTSDAAATNIQCRHHRMRSHVSDAVGQSLRPLPSWWLSTHGNQAIAEETYTLCSSGSIHNLLRRRLLLLLLPHPAAPAM